MKTEPEKREIARATLEVLKDFYRDPANIKAFEEWKRQRA